MKRVGPYYRVALLIIIIIRAVDAHPSDLTSLSLWVLWGSGEEGGGGNERMIVSFCTCSLSHEPLLPLHMPQPPRPPPVQMVNDGTQIELRRPPPAEGSLYVRARVRTYVRAWRSESDSGHSSSG